MEQKELKKAFKKYKNVVFLFTNKNIVFTWGPQKDTGVPYDKIFIGRLGMPRPDYQFSPYEIDRVECTKPGLFKPGILTLFGTEGNALFSAQFKDKGNLKNAVLFNECLALYKQYNLGK